MSDPMFKGRQVFLENTIQRTRQTCAEGLPVLEIVDPAETVIAAVELVVTGFVVLAVVLVLTLVLVLVVLDVTVRLLVVAAEVVVVVVVIVVGVLLAKRIQFDVFDECTVANRLGGYCS